MVDWFDAGQEAYGVIAVGQMATGVIAVGQVATGVIAVGQGARGFIAIGQGSIGLIAVGMGAVGVFHATAMMGIGGAGLGIVLPLVPRWPSTFRPPDTTTLRRLLAGEVPDGWLPVSLVPGEVPGLVHGGSRMQVRFTPAMLAAARRFATEPHHRVLAHLRPFAGGLVVDRLMHVPRRAHRSPRWWLMGAVQLALLAGVSLLFWVVAGRPVIEAVAGLFG